MAANENRETPRIPRALYEQADVLDALSRAREIDSPIRRRILDISEQLREVARLEIRLGVPY